MIEQSEKKPLSNEINKRIEYHFNEIEFSICVCELNVKPTPVFDASVHQRGRREIPELNKIQKNLNLSCENVIYCWQKR